MAEKVLFLVGASGSGKTAALQYLSCLPDFHGACYFFDEIGVPSEDEILELGAQGISWQAQVTRNWIDKLARAPDVLSLLEGQTTPSSIAAEAQRSSLLRWNTVLLDCDSATRLHRLSLRGQPELATTRMDHWAAYLRGQADALHLPVIETSALSIADVAARVQSIAEEL